MKDKYTEWREFLVKRLTGARSLPNQFHVRVIEASRSRFRTGMTVELIDRNRLSTVSLLQRFLLDYEYLRTDSLIYCFPRLKWLL